MPLESDHDLRRSTPEQAGISSSAILGFIEALESQIHEIHSFMLLRHGNIIAEGWWSPYGRDYPHMLFSLSKSFTSTAVGLAVAEGRFSIDDTVMSFFPDERPAEVSDFLAGMRVRHLLSMSTGHGVDTFPYLVNRADGNWIKAFFEVPVAYAPGTHFLYNTGATYMLSAIVQKASGMKLIDYLTPRLFEPLGIKNAAWEESPQGINVGGIGLSLTTEAVARFGQLYLQKGMWRGARLLPEAWVEAASAVQMRSGDDPDNDWTQGYGYQFWRCRHNGYRGDGVFGQYCIIMPEQDAVIAITGGTDAFDMQPPLNLIWQILLPTMQVEGLPDDAIAQQRLAEKLASLSMLPVEEQAQSAFTAQVSGRTYVVDPNELKIETITLTFSATSCTVRIKTAGREESIACGYGHWQRGQTALFNTPGSFDPLQAASSGAWTGEDYFTMVIRLYETPYFHTLAFHFAGDELMVETKVNVSFGPTRPVLLTGRRV